MPPPIISQAEYEETRHKEEEALEKINEKIGEALMDHHEEVISRFIRPPPIRRSDRIANSPRKTYTPTKPVPTTPRKRYHTIEQDPSASFPQYPWPVTAQCKKKHPGLGCAAKHAYHAFEYYDPTAKPIKVNID